MSPELAGEVLGHNVKLVVDKERRLVWEAGSREARHLPVAQVPEGPVHWMGTCEEWLGWGSERPIVQEELAKLGLLCASGRTPDFDPHLRPQAASVGVRP